MVAFRRLRIRPELAERWTKLHASTFALSSLPSAPHGPSIGNLKIHTAPLGRQCAVYNIFAVRAAQSAVRAAQSVERWSNPTSMHVLLVRALVRPHTFCRLPLISAVPGEFSVTGGCMQICGPLAQMPVHEQRAMCAKINKGSMPSVCAALTGLCKRSLVVTYRPICTFLDDRPTYPVIKKYWLRFEKPVRWWSWFLIVYTYARFKALNIECMV